MNKSEITDYVKFNNGTSAAALQSQFGISYKEAKELIEGLVSDGILVYESGVNYVCTKKYYSDGAARRAETERRRTEAIRLVQTVKLDDDGDDYDDEDEEDEELDESDEHYQKLLFDYLNELDGKPEQIEIKIEETPVKKSEPVSSKMMPWHGHWESDELFNDAVEERLARLIRSDIKMGKGGAVKKAESWLDVVRDTCDEKMIEVYEMLVYEIKNISNYAYAQLKKQIFG